MVAKKTKFITLRISGDKLAEFTELPTEFAKSKPKTKAKTAAPESYDEDTTPQPTIKIKIGSKKSGESNSIQRSISVDIPPTPLPNGTTSSSPVPPSTPVPGAGNNVSGASGANNAANTNKSIPYVRSGVGGLMMNPVIVREVDKSGRRVSKWGKYDDPEVAFTRDPVTGEKHAGVTDVASGERVKWHPKVDTGKNLKPKQLNNINKVISFKDIRTIKDHEDSKHQKTLVDEAVLQKRRVIRSFSGYLMMWPTWHKTKEGDFATSVDSGKELENGDVADPLKKETTQ